MSGINKIKAIIDTNLWISFLIGQGLQLIKHSYCRSFRSKEQVSTVSKSCFTENVGCSGNWLMGNPVSSAALALAIL
jgi:hypothetical protein